MVKARGTPFSSTMISMANAKNGLDMAAATGRSAADQSGSGLMNVAQARCVATAENLQA